MTFMNELRKMKTTEEKVSSIKAFVAGTESSLVWRAIAIYDIGLRLNLIETLEEAIEMTHPKATPSIHEEDIWCEPINDASGTIIGIGECCAYAKGNYSFHRETVEEFTSDDWDIITKIDDNNEGGKTND